MQEPGQHCLRRFHYTSLAPHWSTGLSAACNRRRAPTPLLAPERLPTRARVQPWVFLICAPLASITPGFTTSGTRPTTTCCRHRLIPGSSTRCWYQRPTQMVSTCRACDRQICRSRWARTCRGIREPPDTQKETRASATDPSFRSFAPKRANNQWRLTCVNPGALHESRGLRRARSFCGARAAGSGLHASRGRRHHGPSRRGDAALPLIAMRCCICAPHNIP
jgi:hypothetical protein